MNTKTTITDLGWCIGRITIGENNALVIMSPEAVDEHTFQPAQSITIQSLSSLKALQKLLNDALPLQASNDIKKE